MKKIVFVLILSLGMTATAQHRFDAALLGGVNMCQIDGDDAGRYNYLGFRGGIGASFPLSRDVATPWRMVVELAYTQKGSRMVSRDGTIALQYVELPLLLSYTAMEGRLRIAAGVAPAVRVGVAVTFGGLRSAAQEDKYRSVDWLPLTVGLRYLFTDHIAVEGRWQTSLLTIYDGSGPYRIFYSNHGAFNRLISVGLAYQF